MQEQAEAIVGESCLDQAVLFVTYVNKYALGEMTELEAEDWDIRQCLSMTHSERQAAAKLLK